MNPRTLLAIIVKPLGWFTIGLAGLLFVLQPGCGSGEYERRMDKRIGELRSSRSSGDADRSSRDEPDEEEEF